MSSIMNSMWTGVSGLRVNQAALNAAGHNLTNVDTTGYVRQQVLMADHNYNNIGSTYYNTTQVGLGTDMAVIRQVRDDFLDKSYRLEIGRKGFYDSQLEAVMEIEDLFGELQGEKFQDSIGDLWTSIQELQKEPNSITKRMLLVETCTSFLERAQNLKGQLDKYQVSLNQKVISGVKKINSMGHQIQELNELIRKKEAGGETANDYRDARNQLLDELGELVNITYKEDANGVVTVDVEGAQFVTESNVWEMTTEKASDTSNMLKVVWAQSGMGDVFDMDTAYSSAKNTDVGYLKGLLTARGDDASNYTDIPLRENYNSDKAYENAVKEYNDKINPSAIMSLQAQFDQLIHGIVTKINDILSPNASMQDYLSNLGMENVSNTATITVGGITYTVDTATGDAHAVTGLPAAATAAGVTTFTDEKGLIYKINRDATPPTVDIGRADGTVLVRGGAVNVTAPGAFSFTFRDKTYTTTDTSGTQASVRVEYDLDAGSGEFLLWDEGTSPVGDDDENNGKGTQRETLFNRKNMDRYTQATMTITVDGTLQTKTVYIYNREDPENTSSLFTLGQIEVNPEIKKNVSKIPLTGNKYTGAEDGYDITICNKLIEIWGEDFAALDPNTMTPNTFKEYYTSMIGALGNRGKVMDSISTNQQKMIEEIDNGRQAVMGVSADEELTNLIKFQHAYNASAKYISAVDEMLQHIIEKLG